MVYTPTTWVANDVITAAKLNKLEAGARDGTQLSTTDIDTDKDWGAHDITNVGIITGEGIQTTQKKSYAVSDTIIHNLSDEQSVTSESFVTTHAITVPQGYMTSVFRMKFDCRMGSSGWMGQIRIIKNGRVIAFYEQITGTAWTTFSSDLTGIEPGDAFSLQARVYDYSYRIYTRNFQFCGEEDTYVRIIGSSNTSW